MFAEPDCLTGHLLQADSFERNGAVRDKLRSGLLCATGRIAECPYRSLVQGNIRGEFRRKRLYFA